MKNGGKKGNPKTAYTPENKRVKQVEIPESYLQKTPVWRFSDFDWDGPFGLKACEEFGAHIVGHIREHLTSFETMTWAEILKATGGRNHGNNNHEIKRNAFTKEAQGILNNKKIYADTLFSLRLDAGTRVYGVREGACLRIVFFDPYHKDHNKCAYDFS